MMDAGELHGRFPSETDAEIDWPFVPFWPMM